MVAIPVYVRHNIVMKNGSTGRLELTVGPKQSMGKMVCCFYIVYICLNASLKLTMLVC